MQSSSDASAKHEQQTTATAYPVNRMRRSSNISQNKIELTSQTSGAVGLGSHSRRQTSLASRYEITTRTNIMPDWS